MVERGEKGRGIGRDTGRGHVQKDGSGMVKVWDWGIVDSSGNRYLTLELTRCYALRNRVAYLIRGWEIGDSQSDGVRKAK